MKTEGEELSLTLRRFLCTCVFFSIILHSCVTSLFPKAHVLLKPSFGLRLTAEPIVYFDFDTRFHFEVLFAFIRAICYSSELRKYRNITLPESSQIYINPQYLHSKQREAVLARMDTRNCNITLYKPKHYDFRVVVTNYPDCRFKLDYCVNNTIDPKLANDTSQLLITHKYSQSLNSWRNVVYLFPSAPRYFTPAYFPFAATTVDYSSPPIFVIQGGGNFHNPKRNFASVLRLLELSDDFLIKIACRGARDESYFKGDTRVQFLYNINDLDFPHIFQDAFGILPLIDETNFSKYFDKHSSSISWGLHFQLHFVIFEDMGKRYPFVDLSHQRSYYTHSDNFQDAFREALEIFGTSAKS